jgi:phosphoadenosine phosphosulfate reductase
MAIKNLHKEIDYISGKIRDIIVFFSTGKDSVVLLDLCCKYFNRVEAVYLYYVPDLTYKNKILGMYEKRYGIKVHQYPQYDVSDILRKHSIRTDIKKIRPVDLENFLREKFEIPYVAYGYKMVDSVFRGGILNSPDMDHGMNPKLKRVYPLARWSEKEVFEYIKRNKLPLSFEYDYGFRDINIFQGKALEFIKSKSPDDYKKIIDFYPFLEYKSAE